MPRADYVNLTTLCRRTGVASGVAIGIAAELGLPTFSVGGSVYLTEGRARRLATHLARTRRELDGDRDKMRGSRAVALDYVYFIQCEQFVKIGRASDVEARLRGLQKTMPFTLRLLATEEGGEPRETDLHVRFAALRHRGEWFRLEGALESHIRALRDAESRQKPRHRNISEAQMSEDINQLSMLGVARP